ncbi:hypothetical protein CYY_005694 [Polysphondylium violaceum]|uniref:Short-chain dehydrogenase/reductase family protein n=1 Tax=Polysphondylium violaceum TaxID=133409 RepID=A0A8J4PT20_9MYCE|nr:hypothetical protein CYY_005694 [Polysphondylium violaceum]
MSETNRVWYVTGASKGLGLSLVQKLVRAGYSVAATSRNKQELIQNLGSWYNADKVLALQVDLTSDESVEKSIKDTVAKFGTIDVIVNNAGYSLVGSIEASSAEEVKKNFEVNVFAIFNVMRHALPILRANKNPTRPRIMNISSIGGLVGFQAFGVYSSTKFAVNGLSESLDSELAPFGIRCICVLPGYFRTSFLESGATTTKKTISEYTEVQKVVDNHLNVINNNQAGDPNKAAEVFIELSKIPSPPKHFFMGSDSYSMAINAYKGANEELLKWKDLSCSTDFPK